MKTTTITSTIKSLVIAGAIIGTSVFADGGTLYKKCAGCHGMNGEKVALGKSKVIKNMSEKELNDSMNGYKNGTYGGSMKGLMKGQVAKLSTDEIASLTKYIKSL